MTLPPTGAKTTLGSKISVPPMVKEVPYFAEKRVLVTGASSGIGRAVATWYFLFSIRDLPAQVFE